MLIFSVFHNCSSLQVLKYFMLLILFSPISLFHQFSFLLTLVSCQFKAAAGTHKSPTCKCFTVENNLLKPYLLIYLLTVPLFFSLSFLIPSSPISYFPYSPFCFELFKYKQTKLFIIISHLLMLMPEQFWKLKQRV